jgi:site-specific recombinase XerD
MARPAVPGVENLCVDLDNGIYKLRRKVDGTQHYTSLGLRALPEGVKVRSLDGVKLINLREARRLRDQHMGVEKTDVAPDRKTPCEVAFPRYLKIKTDPLLPDPMSDGTESNYSSRWENHISRELKTKPVADVDSNDITRELRAAKKKGLSPATQRGIYTMLSSFFTTCTRDWVGEDGTVTKRYRNDNPVKQLDEREVPPEPKPQRVPKEVIHDYATVRLIAAATLNTRQGYILRTLILFLPLFGLRISEALALKVSDYHKCRPDSAAERAQDTLRNGGIPVDYGDDLGEIHVVRQLAPKAKAKIPSTWFKRLKGRKTTEGNQARVVPVLLTFAKNLLDDYVATGLNEGWLSWDGLLFPATKGNPMGRPRAHRCLQKAVKASGYDKHVSWHHFRHMFITELRRDGNSWEQIAMWAGHSDGGKLCRERYGHITDRTQMHQDAIALAEARRGAM